jgi:two-component system chemotaxis sensor kinase CheA
MHYGAQQAASRLDDIAGGLASVYPGSGPLFVMLGASLEEAAGLVPPDFRESRQALSCVCDCLMDVFRHPGSPPGEGLALLRETLREISCALRAGRESSLNILWWGREFWRWSDSGRGGTCPLPEPGPFVSRDTHVWSLKDLPGSVALVSRNRLELAAETAAAMRAMSGLGEAASDFLREAAKLLDALPSMSASDADGALKKITVLVEQSLNFQELETGQPSGGAGEASPSQEGLISKNAEQALIDDLCAETPRHLSVAEENLLKLDSNPADMDAMNAAFRAFHVIYGMAACVRLEPVARLSGCAQELLFMLRSGERGYDAACAKALLQALDALRVISSAVHAEHSSGQKGALPAYYDGFVKTLGGLADASGRHARAASAPVPAHRPRPQEVEIPAVSAGALTETAAPGLVPANAQGEAFVRVRTEKLENLVDMLGELVISNSMIMQDGAVSSSSNPELYKKISQTGHIVRQMQDMAMSLRMVPMKPSFQKLARAARDIAERTGKSVEFSVQGEDTEIDRAMAAPLEECLLHMVRNAVDHGIEPPHQRIQHGKPAKGHVQITAGEAGGSVLLKISDDGRGLSIGRILKKAIEKGLTVSGSQLSDREIYSFIFATGFSTAEAVTDISGRGVGMDVVKRSVEEMRGSIETDSAEGEGTTFTLRLPLTMAVTDGMVVRVGRQRFIIPTHSIRTAMRPGKVGISSMAGKGQVIRFAGEVVPVFSLGALLGLKEKYAGVHDGVLVVTEDSVGMCAFGVDEIVGQQQVVMKSLGAMLARIRGVSGGSILGDGRVGLILDARELSSMARSGA